MSDLRLYRLHVTYPEGSHAWGWEPKGWADDPANGLPYSSDPDDEDYIPFSWPAVKVYQSRKGASGRANLLRRFGATVRIEESEPITWSGREVSTYGTRTNTRWDNEPSPMADDGEAPY